MRFIFLFFAFAPEIAAAQTVNIDQVGSFAQDAVDDASRAGADFRDYSKKSKSSVVKKCALSVRGAHEKVTQKKLVSNRYRRFNVANSGSCAES